jgi:hypothetical protein
MSYSLTFWFNDKNVETKYRDETECFEGIRGLENLIVKDLKKGESLEDQKLKWTEMLEDINEDWDIIEVNSNGMKNFVAGIVILKKLNVKLDVGYIDTESFKLIHSDGFIDSKDFRKMYKQATGKNVRRPCSICQTKTTKRCSCCKNTYYCSEACQQSDWKSHRKK